MITLESKNKLINKVFQYKCSDLYTVSEIECTTLKELKIKYLYANSLINELINYRDFIEATCPALFKDGSIDFYEQTEEEYTKRRSGLKLDTDVYDSLEEIFTEYRELFSKECVTKFVENNLKDLYDYKLLRDDNSEFEKFDYDSLDKDERIYELRRANIRQIENWIAVEDELNAIKALNIHKEQLPRL